MSKPTGYTKALDTLTQRFKEKHDSQNTLHTNLQVKLNDLSSQLQAVEFIRQNPQGGDHVLNVGRAAARLRTLAEAAADAVSKKATEAEGSFEAVLREHGKLQPGPFGAEIRQRIHSMTPGERVKAIQSLIESKDGVSLAAVFDAPSILTGLPSEDTAKFKEQFYQAACPDLVKARDTYRNLTEHVQAAVKTALSAALEYSDPVKLRALELREAEAAKAEAALKGE